MPSPDIFDVVANAQLRGEARNDQATALHFYTKTNAYQKCHACWIPLELFVSTLPLKLLANANILKYSTKLVTKNTEAKPTTTKLKANFKMQVV